MISASSIQETVGLIEYLKFVPYDVSRKQLYSSDELYKGYDCDNPDSFATCFDTKVYNHFIAHGKQASTDAEALARALHDHGVRMAVDEFFNHRDERACVGIMGGHALKRVDKIFGLVALISRKLTEMGFTMVSGGGPGAMEATHLGAWMAGRSDADMLEAINVLAQAPCFGDEGWLATAMQVKRMFEQTQYQSLGIPTWLYGHEPSTPFATHIAKFFENSIREDLVLTLPYGGIIYTPGSAGTMQEIFQDAVQNHYLSYGLSSPMIFFGAKFWTEEMPVYPLLKELSDSGRYRNLLLTLTDDPNEVIDVLQRFNQCRHQE
ncbi:MAG: hypothetical protein IJ613_09480 [Muribaculaceae bacterium]|nr:hypothetical protein [Muribaculaceae bacterium]